MWTYERRQAGTDSRAGQTRASSRGIQGLGRGRKEVRKPLEQQGSRHRGSGCELTNAARQGTDSRAGQTRASSRAPY